MLSSTDTKRGAQDYFDVNKFTFLSDPVPLRYGEVHNKLQAPIPLPEDLVKQFEGGKMGIVNYAIDIVFEDGSQAPLSQGYNHHYGLIMGSADVMDDLYEKYGKEVLGSSMGGGAHLFRSLRATVEEHNKHNKDKRVASFGGGSGAEERHTAHGVAAPYAHVIDTPEKFMPLIHLINTKGAKTEAGYSPLLECPCTPQREIDVARGLIDGKPPMPPFACNAQFLEAKNPSCSIALYEGGYRCCEHGNFLRDLNKQPVRDDEQVTTFRFKFTVEVREVSEDVVPLRPAGCCDVTGNTTHFGNIEYDVPKVSHARMQPSSLSHCYFFIADTPISPQCATGTPPAQCIHEATSVQPIDMALGGFGSMTRETIDPNALIDLVQITGHLHVGGISFDLYNDATGELLCHSVPTYGETHAAGDEKGYVVGMSRYV